MSGGSHPLKLGGARCVAYPSLDISWASKPRLAESSIMARRIADHCLDDIRHSLPSDQATVRVNNQISWRKANGPWANIFGFMGEVSGGRTRIRT